MATYQYRRGDGNEGNFTCHLVRLSDTDNPFAALRALVLNEWTLCDTRTYIAAEIQTDGDAEYGVHAWVYEGPQGETAFGAAWLTAELEPIEDDPEADTLADVLDPEAMADYATQCAKE
jgi:hypothetical protein